MLFIVQHIKYCLGSIIVAKLPANTYMYCAMPCISLRPPEQVHKTIASNSVGRFKRYYKACILIYVVRALQYIVALLLSHNGERHLLLMWFLIKRFVT